MKIKGSSKFMSSGTVREDFMAEEGIGPSWGGVQGYDSPLANIPRPTDTLVTQEV